MSYTTSCTATLHVIRVLLFLQEAGKEKTPNSYDHLESVAPNQVAASVQEEETAHSCINAEEREESDNKLMVDRQAYDHLS